jgi:hypothetical protein
MIQIQRGAAVGPAFCREGCGVVSLPCRRVVSTVNTINMLSSTLAPTVSGSGSSVRCTGRRQQR